MRAFSFAHTLLGKFRRKESAQSIDKTAPFAQAENYPAE
jgi:hypothetical protein